MVGHAGDLLQLGREESSLRTLARKLPESTVEEEGRRVAKAAAASTGNNALFCDSGLKAFLSFSKGFLGLSSCHSWHICSYMVCLPALSGVQHPNWTVQSVWQVGIWAPSGGISEIFLPPCFFKLLLACCLSRSSFVRILLVYILKWWLYCSICLLHGNRWLSTADRILKYFMNFSLSKFK